MRVPATLFPIPVRRDDTQWTDGLAAVCARCGAVSTVRGQGDRSVVAALVRLRAACPKRESNRYESETAEDRRAGASAYVGPAPTGSETRAAPLPDDTWFGGE